MDEGLVNIYFIKMEERKPNLVFLHQDALLTGSAISLRNTIKAIKHFTTSIHIVTPSIGPAIKIWQEVGAKTSVFPFTTFWTSPGPKFFSRGEIKQLKGLLPNKKLKKYILSLNPDIIHINDKAAIQAGISLRNSGIPIVQHSRSAYHLTECKLNAWLSSTFIMQYASHIICISEDEIQGFESFKSKSVIYNTVDIEEAESANFKRKKTRDTLGINDDEIVIGMAENFSVNKGLLDIIEIAQKVIEKNKMKKIKFLLVGNMTETIKIGKSHIKSQVFVDNFIHKNNLNKYFIITGFKENVLDYIASMDIIIVTKAHGVLGRQPLEAQSVGTVVLARDGHSGNSQIIVNNIGGYKTKNTNEIIDFLDFLLNNNKNINELKKRGKAYAKLNFNLKKYGTKINKIYQNLLK